jgi:predicted butyrate kinase (DUF1464 family)
MNQPAPASPLSFRESEITDADLMHMAVYGDNPVQRDAAIRAFGRREFTKGMRAANQVHSFFTDKLVAGVAR